VVEYFLLSKECVGNVTSRLARARNAPGGKVSRSCRARRDVLFFLSTATFDESAARPDFKFGARADDIASV
jgi:hypothetical protein